MGTTVPWALYKATRILRKPEGILRIVAQGEFAHNLVECLCRSLNAGPQRRGCT